MSRLSRTLLWNRSVNSKPQRLQRFVWRACFWPTSIHRLLRERRHCRQKRTRSPYQRPQRQRFIQMLLGTATIVTIARSAWHSLTRKYPFAGTDRIRWILPDAPVCVSLTNKSAIALTSMRLGSYWNIGESLWKLINFPKIFFEFIASSARLRDSLTFIEIKKSRPYRKI